MQDQTAAAARGTAPQDQYVLQIVEIGIVSNSIAQIDPHGPPYLNGAGLASLQLFLNRPEHFGFGHVNR